HEVSAGLIDGDAELVDGGGEAALHAGDAVLHVDGGDVEVVAGLEGDRDHAGAVVGAGGAHVAHALDAVDGFFQRNGDGLLHGFGVGAYVVSDDADLGRRKLGVEGDGEGRNAHRTREDNEERAHGSEDRPENKEIDKQGKAFL